MREPALDCVEVEGTGVEQLEERRFRRGDALGGERNGRRGSRGDGDQPVRVAVEQVPGTDRQPPTTTSLPTSQMIPSPCETTGPRAKTWKPGARRLIPARSRHPLSVTIPTAPRR